MMQQVAIAVSDASQVGEARRAAASVSHQAKLDETHAGRVAIIVTELATNLVRYAQRGKILLRAYATKDKSEGVEILAVDSGPGFDVGKGMIDGYSTGGTPGNGLGAVRRLSSTFDIYSHSPAGTVIMARVMNEATPSLKPQWDYGCVSMPAPYETACGDAWSASCKNGTAGFMIADGLGHGPEAAAASGVADATFRNDPSIEAGRFIELSHQAMSGTRGAAVAMATIDLTQGKIHFAGVGNIAGTLISAQKRQGLPSQNGIVGARLPRVKVFEYTLPTPGILIMHSDGLQSRWSLDAYPGLPLCHPSVIAGVLYRDFYRDRDDITVLVAAWHGGGS